MTELTDEEAKALLTECDNPDCLTCEYARALLAARAELAQARADTDALSDPNAVHINMLRGTIAKPPLEQIIHLYGVDALCKALMLVIVREAEAAIIRKGGTL